VFNPLSLAKQLLHAIPYSPVIVNDTAFFKVMELVFNKTSTMAKWTLVVFNKFVSEIDALAALTNTELLRKLDGALRYHGNLISLQWKPIKIFT
jgi:hypothetical protein